MVFYYNKGGNILGKGRVNHRRALHGNIQGIRKPSLRRLARRGGVKRISNVCYEDVRGILKEFLEDVVGVCNNSKS